MMYEVSFFIPSSIVSPGRATIYKMKEITELTFLLLSPSCAADTGDC